MYSNSTSAPLGANCAEAHRYRGPTCDQPVSRPPNPPKIELTWLRDTSGIHSETSPLTNAELAVSNCRRNAAKSGVTRLFCLGVRRGELAGQVLDEQADV